MEAAATATSGETSTGPAAAFGFDDSELLELKPEAAPGISNVRKKVKLSHDALFEEEKGFKSILDTFPKIKFRGKGKEFEDLNLLILHYKRWFQNVQPESSEGLEDAVWKVRSVLSEREKDDGSKGASDPRERLHMFRCMYKTRAHSAGAGSAGSAGAGPGSSTGRAGGSLPDEVQKRIEANRQLALDRRKKKQEEEDEAMFGPSGGGGGGGGFDDDEDPFGMGFGLDDDFGGPAPQAQSRPAAAVGAPPSVSDSTKAKIEANKAQALEKKRKRQEEEELAAQEEAMNGGFGFEEEDDPFGLGFGLDDDPVAPPVRSAAPNPAAELGNQASGAENQLSDDAKARIEANKQRALEARRKKAEELARQTAQVPADEPAEAHEVNDAPKDTPFEEEDDVFGFGFDMED